MFSKQNIREQIKQRRLELDAETVKRSSAACCSQILSLNEYQECKTILLYAAVRNELDVGAILRDALEHNKMVGMPVCYEQGHMEFYAVFDESDLKPGKYFGIPEPPKDLLVDVSDAVMLVPAVAYDRRKNRIGQGGGYYDRYLNLHKDIFTIGVAYDCQLVDSFETEEFDQPVDLVVTDTSVII